MDIKAINYDVDINKVEAGTTVNARNLVFLDSIKSVTNEKGLKFVYDLKEDKNFLVCGAIAIPENKIVFFLSLNGTSSIKLFDIETNEMSLIVEDESFNFDPAYGVQGDYVYNALEQCYTVVFTDTRVPRQVNIKTNHYTTFVDNRTRLFPNCKVPVITISNIENNGGFIQTGSYSFCTRYVNIDGYSTSWVSLSDPVNIYKDPLTQGRTFYIGNTSNEFSSKSVLLGVTNVDISFDYIEFAFVQKLNGIIQSFSFTKLPTKEQISITFTGRETKTAVALENILVINSNPEKVFSLTFANTQLYLAGVTNPQNFDYQPYANNIKVWAVRKRLPIQNGVVNAGETGLNGTTGGMHLQNNNTKLTTFKANEVKGYYIVLVFNDGSKSSAFHIPGVGPQGTFRSDGVVTAIDAIYNNGFGGLNYYARQMHYLEPVVTAPNVNWKRTGPYFNEDEFYPNTASFDVLDVDSNGNAVNVGSLRNQKVRHHFMPGLNDFGGVARDRGETKVIVPFIGIALTDIKFPKNLVDLIQGYEIYYTKADSNNVIVNAQDLLLYGTVNSNNTNHISTNSLNCNLVNAGDNKNLTHFHYRFHNPELLINKPSINPSAIRVNSFAYGYGFSTPDTGRILRFSNGVGFTWHQTFKKGIIMDFCAAIGSVLVPAVGNTNFYKLEASHYIPNNSVVPNILRDNKVAHNMGGEEYFHCETGSGYVTNTNNTLNFDTVRDNISNQVFGGSTIVNGITDHYMRTALVDICTFYRNMFVNFYNQQIVQATAMFDKSLSQTGELYCGDNEWALHTFTTSSNRYGSETTEETNGIITAYRIPIQTYLPISLRYQDNADKNTYFYPAADLGRTDIDGFNTDQQYPAFLKVTDNPKILINKDFAFVNNVSRATPFVPNTVIVNEFRNDILASLVSAEGETTNRWRNFLVNNRITVESKFGRIIKLTFDGVNMLIHCENILYKTRANQNLSTTEGTVFVGNGDIFSVALQPVMTAELGYAGLQQRFAAIQCPLGYCFYDAASQDLFILSSGLDKISTKGFINYFNQFKPIYKYSAETDANMQGGTQFILGYDAEFNRLILTFILETKTGSVVLETLSYSPDYNGFVSFHDTLPKLYIPSRDALFSISLENELHKVNGNKYGVTDLGERNSALPSEAQVVISNDANKQIIFNAVDITMTEFIDDYDAIELASSVSLGVYSNRHYSGLTKLLPIKNSRTIKNILHFNKVRNRLIDITTAFRKDFHKLVSDDVCIDLNKPWNKQNNISGNHIVLVIKLDNDTKNKIAIRGIEGNFSISDR
jgi:hypothetical protein